MIITLNGSKAAADLVAMLPLELRLIGHAESGAEALAHEKGKVRLELVK